ncbi:MULTISPECIES: hypothetical protein [unclassified Methylobacterium]|jgi:hypothetical protein|uniref:hypothetical protein n=1 Tax=unclassified Methylobacterium TaxID=2615210 RepID=UPI0006F81179|nr:MULTISPECIES: hypothetical protein [unclassified Methylobacterium]KQO70573.1 hypothetical protein ASF20_18875 [Methylobacterium sp. Leaf88]KQO72278.1 hypothetical protein ASF18_19180 [Methylobacterium sp. Leaf89]KQP51208.1 hypothetical protein ASF41_13605 [Methylobacterium sp. Leaf111]KQU16298.1 hypothetical protein ASG63_10895 [Methylobacterium sp. Leaf94]
MDDVDPDRAVMIRLRARLAVVERAAWFGLVQAMRTQPAETEAYLTAERAKCAEGFGQRGWAADLTEAERRLLGAEVDAGLAGLIADSKAELGQT